MILFMEQSGPSYSKLKHCEGLLLYLFGYKIGMFLTKIIPNKFIGIVISARR